MNIFEQLREMKVSSEYEAAKKLHRFTKVFFGSRRFGVGGFRIGIASASIYGK